MQTHNNSIANLTRGVGERVLFTNNRLDKPIIPVDGIFVNRLASYREQLVNDIGFQSPVTHQQFVDFYKGPRKLIYQRAVDGLVMEPVRHRDAYLKTFVKAEKLNFNVKYDPAPRVIQPRNPRYNVEVGCYLRPLEKKIYDAIDNIFQSPTIMSSYNAFKQAAVLKEKWDSFSNPVCIGLDASRFDQHVSKQALEFEHTVYDSIFHSKKLRMLLKMQLFNRGIARASDGWFTYEKEGSRMSGDMNTSMGNKLLMCFMAKYYLSTLNFRCEFANNGDDCLIFTERKNLKGLDDMEKIFESFGFNIVRETPVTEFERIEFCQTKPVKCNGIWRMVRNVTTCLTKDVTCVNLGHDVEMYRRLLYDIGTCGAASSNDVPVLGSFYRMLQRFGSTGNYMGKWNNEFTYYYTSSRNCHCDYDKPDEFGRYSFWLNTGISPDEQVQLEGYFDRSVWGADNRQIIDFDLERIIFNDKT